MGTNSLDKNFTNGDVVRDSHVKQFANALEGDIVGRDSSGAPARGQRLGTPTIPFGQANVESLNVDGRFVNPRVISKSKYQIISGGTYDESGTPDGLGGWPFFLKVSNNGKIIYLDASDVNPFVAAIGETNIEITEPISFDIRTASPSIGVKTGGTVSTGIFSRFVSTSPTDRGFTFLHERSADYSGEPDFFPAIFGRVSETTARLFQAEITSTSGPRYTVGNLTLKNGRIYGACHAESESVSGRRMFSMELGFEDDTLSFIKNVRRNIGFYPPQASSPNGDEMNNGIYTHNATQTFLRFSSYNMNRFCVGLTVFLNDRSELLITTRKPVRSAVAPEDAELNDFWYDSQQDQWNRFSAGEQWININAIPIGIAYFDGWVICAVESFHFDTPGISNENSVHVTNERITSNEITARGVVSVNGKRINFDGTWDVVESEEQDKTALATATTAGGPVVTDFLSNGGLPPRDERGSGTIRGDASRPIYFYVHESGRHFYDTKRPQYSFEMQGHYHPFRMARCVASTLFSFHSPDSTFNGFDNSQHDYEGLATVRQFHTYEKYNVHSRKEMQYTCTLRRNSSTSYSLYFPDERTRIYESILTNSPGLRIRPNPIFVNSSVSPRSARARIVSTHNNGSASIPTQTSDSRAGRQDEFVDQDGYRINITSNDASMTIVAEVANSVRGQFILDNEIK